MDEILIWPRIRLWSPIDKCFYSGSIDAFDSKSISHKVSYDNREVELLSLAREKWEVVSYVSSPEEEVENLDPTPTRNAKHTLMKAVKGGRPDLEKIVLQASLFLFFGFF